MQLDVKGPVVLQCYIRLFPTGQGAAYFVQNNRDPCKQYTD